jgi:hypothetical protein
MLKFYSTLLIFLLLAGNSGAQVSVPEAIQTFGSGSQTTHLFIDFNDGSQRECWSFTYHYDGNPNLGNLLSDIEAAYPWISFDLSGGFLNSVSLGNQSQTGGNPDYWMTFSYDTSGGWVINNGLSAPLSEAAIFGCSYTPLDSSWTPVYYPQNAVSALKYFSADSISQWVGTGSQHALLVIDFNDGSSSECYAWGYRFDGNANAQTMIEAIAASDPNIAFNLDFGFLNDIVYGSQQGIAASPEYWSTFSGMNPYSWDFNSGIDAPLSDGLWFGCSYTPYDANWSPVHYPENPVAAVWVQGIENHSERSITIGPNPVADELQVQCKGDEIAYEILDVSGASVMGEFLNGELMFTVNLSHLASGIYQLKLIGGSNASWVKFIKL